MKTKKIVAALAAATMIASVIPMQAMAATPLLDGTLDYNFEDGVVPDSVLPNRNIRNGAKVHADDWNAEIVDAGTENKALKYTFDSKANTITRSDGGIWTGPLFYKAIDPSKWGKNKWFSYSFRYKMDKTLNMNSNTVFMSFVTPEGNGKMKVLYNNGNITVNSAKVSSPVGKWVTVNTVMYRSPSEAGNYITAAEVSLNYEGGNGESVTQVVNTALNGAFNGWGGPGCLAMTANSKNLTDGDSFLIDDIKFTELEDDELVKVTFNTNGGSNIAPVGTAIGAIDLNWADTPVKANATFDGWYRDEALTEPFDGTGITENMTVYAKWNEAYNLTFVTGEGGSAVDDILVEKDSAALHKLPFPTKSGYVFGGWFEDEGCTMLYDGTSVTESKTLYAKWIESSDLYNVSFDGRAYPDDLEVIQLANSNGYWSSGVETDENGNSYMKYTRTHTGKFVKGGILSFNTIKFLNYSNGNDTKTPITNGVGYEIGYKFKPNASNFDKFMALSASRKTTAAQISYWTANGGKLVANCGSGANLKSVTINDYADDFISVTLKIDPSGDSGKGTGEQTITYKNTSGETVTEKLCFVFEMRDSAGNYAHKLSPFTISQSSDTTGDDSFCLDDIYVRPAETKTVTFEINDPEITVEPIKTATSLIILPTYEKDGYALSWYKDSDYAEPFDGTGIESDMTVYGRLEKLHTLTFVTGSDTVIDPIVTTGAIDISDIKPENGVLRFDGWYEDEQCSVPFTATSIDKDTTIYAKWSTQLVDIDFESDDKDYTEFNSTSRHVVNERVLDADGNYAMKYTFNKNGEWQNSSGLFSYKIPTEFRTDGTTYELSYRFKPTKGQLLFPRLYAVSRYGSAVFFNIDTNSSVAVGYTGEIPGNDNKFILEDLNGYVTVRALYNPGEKHIAVYITGRKADGTDFRLNYESDNVLDNAPTHTPLTTLYIAAIPYYAPANGTEMLLDDISLRVAEAHNVTFDYMYDNKIETVETDLFGKVTLPEPERENYKLIGWYKDKSFTVPFDGIGVENDMTVYGFWQTVPKIEMTEPASGNANVSRTPAIRLYFDSRMDANTLNTSTITVYKGDEAIEPEYYTVQTEDVDIKTVATIRFNHDLDLGCTYTVKVSTGAKNICYNMAEEFTMSFTVKGLTLSVDNIAVTDESGNEVKSLKSNAGKKINVSFKITNNSGEEVVYTPILSLHKKGALNEVAIGADNSENVEIKLPENTEDSDELGLMVFDSMEGMKPLIEKTKIE